MVLTELVFLGFLFVFSSSIRASPYQPDRDQQTWPSFRRVLVRSRREQGERKRENKEGERKMRREMSERLYKILPPITTDEVAREVFFGNARAYREQEIDVFIFECAAEQFTKK